MNGWGIWRTEAGQDAAQGQWFLDGSNGKAYVYETELQARCSMSGLRLLLPQNGYDAYLLHPCMGDWHLSPKAFTKCPVCKGSGMLPPTPHRTTIPDL